MRAFRNPSLVGLLALSLLSLSLQTAKAGGGDPTWRRLQNSRAYLNSGAYYSNPAPVTPAATTATNGTYRSYSTEPGGSVVPVWQLYYYVDAGYYHYYYAPPRAAAPPAPGAGLPVPAPKTSAK